jgi:1-deoxy-D-xylulose-5-phosphate reductoisomerase
MKKQIAILGSTGSIGTQALQVIEEHSDLYEVYALTANNKVDLLAEQARKFQPEVVVIANNPSGISTVNTFCALSISSINSS